ncbi:site-specific DNA-methyltransferase [Pseudoruegeria aquimaris]|nr:site-specific DNA-methyltransferase [Pseudoruegeria aquimaris]
MPTLDWIGKKAVVNHHREVPYRLVHCDGELSAGDPDAANLLVQGDNLEALKALLPYYAGKVKCIYIDPPYNTGNEGWVYNDNVASPEIKAWLGKVVGKEAEDLSRHDKWLCMMYPRLRLLREFLREDGVIAVSISETEINNLKMMMTEVFGEQNFVAEVIVESNTRGQTYKAIARTHEYCLIFSKSDAAELSEISDLDRAFPFSDNRGGYELWELRNRNPRFNRENRPNLYFPLYADPEPFQHDHHRVGLTRTHPDQIEVYPVDGNGNDDCWRWSENLIKTKELGGESPDLIARQTRSGKWTVWQRARKKTKSAKSIFRGSEYLNEAGTTLLSSMGMRGEFDHPKPIGLLRTIIELATDEEDIVLDSFAGSGTTGHAVLDLNRAGNGNRQFILVEMDQQIASNVTAKRLKIAIQGYDKGGDPKKPVEGLGGGYRYCRLGTPLFNEFGDIHEAVSFPDLAAHVFFSETGAPLPKKVDGSTPLIGQHKNKIVYLLFSPAEQGFPREAAGNVLTPDALASLPSAPEGFDGERVVYAEGCTVSSERLKAEGVVFKQIPYQIEGA